MAQGRDKAGSDGRARVFAEAEVKLMRFGRVAGTYRGTYATLRLAEGVVEFSRGATAEVGGATVAAEGLTLDLARDRLTARGRVTLQEHGVTLAGDSLAAQPTLGGMKLGGRVRLRTDSAEAARALFESGLI